MTAGRAEHASQPMKVSSISNALDTPLNKYHPGYTVSPDCGFFEAFLSRFDAWQMNEARAGAVDTVLGVTHKELQDRRDVKECERERYAEILNEAYSGDGMNDPVAFLRGLSQTDLDLVGRIHSLADAIDPNALTREGAYHLLLPEGYKVDLNRDGVSEVGIAKVCIFPPLDAPESFRSAWLSATSNMSEPDYFTHQIVLWSALHPMGGSTRKTVHGLPTDEESSYSLILNELLEANERLRLHLAPGQYERDKDFYHKLLSLLAL